MNNLLIIVQEDFKEALDEFNPIEAVLPTTDSRYLRDFQERTLGQISRMVFPSLAVGPDRVGSILSDGGDRLIQGIRFSSWIGVTDDGHETVTRRAMKYANAYEQVLRSARKSRWFVNMSTQVFGFVLDEIEHIYGPVGSEDSVYFRAVRINGTIQINER